MDFSRTKQDASGEDATLPALQASVVGSCLVSYCPDVAVQDQQNIQDCLIYAELAANNRYPDQRFPKAWFDYYQSRLLKAGMTLKSIVPASPINITSHYELSGVCFDLIARLGSKELARLAKRTYQALKVDDLAWDYFKEGVIKSSQSIVKFAPCERLVTGEIIVVLFGLRYETTLLEDDWFFWRTFDRQLTLIPDGGVFVFNSNLFADYREGVIGKIDRYTEKIVVKRLEG